MAWGLLGLATNTCSGSSSSSKHIVLYFKESSTTLHNAMRLVGVGHKHLQQQQQQQETVIEEEVRTLASFTGCCLAGTRLQLPNIPSASSRVM
jgi:hypothetical protein